MYTPVIEAYDDISELLRQIIGMHKIKYSVLDSMLELKNINCIHINLDSIFSSITAKYLQKSNEIDSSYRYVIASSILNIVAHYRHYCVMRRWTPTIYMYVTNKWQECLESGMKITEIISNYIDKVYFLKVSKHDIPAVYMRYFIKKDKNSKHLVLTKDICDLQLVSNRVHLIHLNKDNSVYYSPENLYENFTEGKVTNSKLSHKLIGPVLFFSGEGMKNKGVQSYGRKKTVKLFTKLVDEGTIVNDRYSSYHDLVIDISKEVMEDYTHFRINFESKDVYSIYDKVMTSSKKKILDSYIIDKFSKKDLMDLNNKYFTGLDSLLLEYLLELPADGSAGGSTNIKW